MMIFLIVKPVITYTPTQWRGYKPRQRRWGSFSLANCKHIFGIYYKLTPIGLGTKIMIFLKLTPMLLSI